MNKSKYAINDFTLCSKIINMEKDWIFKKTNSTWDFQHRPRNS